MQPCLILLSSRPTQDSTAGLYEIHLAKRTLRSLAARGFMLALLLGCLTGTHAIAEPIVVNKPVMESPEARFAEPELQAKYDEAWKTFAETVEAASAALTKELKDRVQAAREGGNLDLVKHWTAVDEQWGQTGEFEWDADEERRKWERFAPSVFPHSVTIAARGTAETHKAAIEELQGSYKELEQELVKAGDNKRAGEVRQEIAGLLEANDFKNEKGKRTAPGSRRSVSKIRDQFVGEWSNANWHHVNILTAQQGTVDRGKVVRRRKDGRITDGGSWVVDADGEARVLLQVGGAKGWKELVKRFPNGLMVGGSRNPEGELSGDGWVMWPEGFDWKGERCQNVDAAAEAKANVAGKWTHPNWPGIWVISESGELVEDRKSGGTTKSGSWHLQTDGSYDCRLSDGWRLRFWVAGETLAALPFNPQGDLAGDGIVCERVGDAPENK